MVPAMVSRCCSRMAWRICPWLRSLQPQMAFSLFGLTSAAPPTVLIRICSTKPAHEPQELAALVCFLTSSTLNSPCSWIALTMVPLHTPLQPQTSAVSAMLMALSWP
ncbi:hypothetical protein D3C79_991590 [compost metagenome]